MAISVTNLGTAAGASVFTSGSAPSGSLICCAVWEDASSSDPGSGGTLSDTHNTYTKLDKSSGGNGTLSFFYVVNASLSSGANVAYTPVDGSNNCYMSMFYVTGIATSSAYDSAVFVSATGASGQPNMTSGTPGVTGELFIAIDGGPSTFTLDTGDGWATPPNSATDLWGGSQVNAGTGTKTFHPTGGNLSPWCAMIVGFKPLGSTAYSMSTAVGSYAISGKSPTIVHAKSIVSAVGSYAISGKSPTIVHAKSIVSAVGSYAITGLSPVIHHAKSIISAVGSYVITAINPNINHAAKLTTAVGSYAITGLSPVIHHTRTLIAAVGAYVYTGINVVMQHAYKLVQVAGSYVITGVVPSITSKRHLTAAVGSYVYTGISPTITSARKIVAAVGSYAITGFHPILSWVIAPVTKFLLRVDKPVLYMVRSVQPVLGQVRAALGSLYQTRQKPPTLDD